LFNIYFAIYLSLHHYHRIYFKGFYFQLEKRGEGERDRNKGVVNNKNLENLGGGITLPKTRFI